MALLRRRDDFQEKLHRLKKELLDEIQTGNIQPGEFILPENTLSEKYSLSRVSVRKVLAELVEEGLIEKIAGKGNRVTFPDSSKQRQMLKLAWFSSSYELDIVRKIIDQYEESQPYVGIQLMILPDEDYINSLIQSMEQGEGPDVFMVSDFHIRELLAKKRTELLMPFESDQLALDSYPQVFDLFTLNQQLIAAPFLFSPVVVCFNEKLFHEAGLDGRDDIRDWADLIAAAKLCTVTAGDTNDNPGVTERYGFSFSSSPNRWPVFVLQNGGKLVNERGEWQLSDAATVEALNFCVDLMYKEKVSPIYTHGSKDLAERLFVKERVAMILSTYYFMNEFPDHSIKWNVAPVPGNKYPATLLLGGGLAINQKSEHLTLTQQFVTYMVGKDAQTLLKENGCTIPALRSIAEDDRLLNPRIHPRNYNAFIGMLENSHSLLGMGINTDELLQVMDELQLMWGNMESPEDACKRIDASFKGAG